MATTTIALKKLARNASPDADSRLLAPSDSSDVTAAKNGVIEVADPSEMMLLLIGSSTGNTKVTVYASTDPSDPAFSAQGQGNFTFTTTAGSKDYIIGPFDGARFTNTSTGHAIYIALATTTGATVGGARGTVSAIGFVTTT